MNKKILFIIIASLSLSGLSFGQTLGISGSKMWSNSSDLKNPIGFNILLSQSIFKNGDIQLEYSYYQSKYSDLSSFSTGLDPTPGIDETIENVAYLHSFELYLQYRLIEIGFIDFSIGGGFTVINLNLLKDGLTTKKTSHFDDTRLGIIGAVIIETKESLLSPFSLYFVGKFKETKSFVVRTGGTTPFDSAIIYRTVQFGVKINLENILNRI